MMQNREVSHEDINSSNSRSSGQDIEDRIRSMLEDSVMTATASNSTSTTTTTLASSSNNNNNNRILEFQQRLATFRPSTYFAKPPLLSPLVCARFGWTNVGPDVVVCCECQATLVIQIHPQLSTKATMEVCQSIRTELAKAHSNDCSFRVDAETNLLVVDNNTTTTTTLPTSQTEKARIAESLLLMMLSSSSHQMNMMVPAYMASVLPPSLLEFMEHPAPRQLLHDRTLKLVHAASSCCRRNHGDAHDPQQQQQQQCVMPSRQSVVFMEEEPGDHHNMAVGVANTPHQPDEQQQHVSTTISRISRILGLSSHHEPAVWLALSGWEPLTAAAAATMTTNRTVLANNSSSTTINQSLHVQCKVCLVCSDIPLDDNDDDDAAGNDEDFNTITEENTIVVGEQQEREENNPLVHHRDNDDSGMHRPKRQRTTTAAAIRMNPMTSHRHYCPFISGFPSTESSSSSSVWSTTQPLWKTIACRILQQYDDDCVNDMVSAGNNNHREEDSADRIHAMLKVGIVSSAARETTNGFIHSQ